MIRNISIDESSNATIQKKANSLGLSFSAFVRLAGITFETGAPHSAKSEAPETPERDHDDK